MAKTTTEKGYGMLSVSRVSPGQLLVRVVPIMLALITACSAPSSQSDQAGSIAVRDSAGVRIVEYPRSVIEDTGTWAGVDPEATLEIGSLQGDPPHLFVSIDTAIESPDGQIVVADNGISGASNEIRIFDHAGSHLRTFGGKGEGPGEFKANPTIRLVPPDTILAWDPRQRRLTWFTLDGDIARDEFLGTAVQGLPMMFAAGAWVLAASGGLTVVEPGLAPPREDRQGLIQTKYALLIFPAGSTDLRQITGLPGEARLYAAPSRRLSVGLDFFPTVGWNWAVWDRRESIVVADDPEGRWALSVYAHDGVRTESIRAEVPRKTVAGELEQKERNRLIERTEDFPAAERADIRSAFDRVAMPDSAPAIGQVFTDASSRLWVKRWSSMTETEGTDIYDVIDPSDRWLGSVEVDRSLGRILSIGDDHILFFVRGSLDVPMVRRHSLHRTESSDDLK